MLTRLVMIIESLCCIPETDMLNVNYISIKITKRRNEPIWNEINIPILPLTSVKPFQVY